MEHLLKQVDQAYETLSGPALEAQLQALLSQCRTAHGGRGPQYAAMLSELGGYYRGQRRLEESESAFQEALDQLAQCSGVQSPDYATALNNLAGTHRLMGRYEQAGREFAACLELYAGTVGREHILYASGLNNLSLLCLDQGDLTQAAALQTQAAEVLTRLPDHQDELASCLCNLGALYQQSGQPDRAERCLLRAVDLFEGPLGTDTPHYHAALNALGIVCYTSGRYAGAVQWFSVAAEAARKLYGCDHPEVQAAMAHLELAKQAAEARP